MIEIVSGIAIDSTARVVKSYSPQDGPIDVGPELEALWVSRGIARYVAKAEEAPASDDEVEDDDSGAETSDEDDVDDGEALDDGDDPDPIDYTSLKLAELKAEADERGLTYPKRANRADMIALLEENDAPPDLTAQEVQ